MMAEWLFLAMPCGCLRFVIVIFPDHTYLLFSCLIFIIFPFQIFNLQGIFSGKFFTIKLQRLKALFAVNKLQSNHILLAKPNGIS